jgi:flagellar biosynthesis GTPase FlhF
MSSKDEPPSCASLFPEMVKSNESQSRSSNTETISRKEKKKQKKKEKKKKERKEKKSREKKEEKKKKRKKKVTLEEWSEATEFEENEYDQSYADHFVDDVRKEFEGKCLGDEDDTASESEDISEQGLEMNYGHNTPDDEKSNHDCKKASSSGCKICCKAFSIPEGIESYKELEVLLKKYEKETSQIFSIHSSKTVESYNACIKKRKYLCMPESYQYRVLHLKCFRCNYLRDEKGISDQQVTVEAGKVYSGKKKKKKPSFGIYGL